MNSVIRGISSFQQEVISLHSRTMPIILYLALVLSLLLDNTYQGVRNVLYSSTSACSMLDTSSFSSRRTFINWFLQELAGGAPINGRKEVMYIFLSLHFEIHIPDLLAKLFSSTKYDRSVRYEGSKIYCVVSRRTLKYDYQTGWFKINSMYYNNG